MKDRRLTWLIESIQRVSAIKQITIEDAYYAICSQPKTKAERERFEKAKIQLEL